MLNRIKMWWLTRKGVVDIGNGAPLDVRSVRQPEEITIDDLPKQVLDDYAANLKDEFYKGFDFMSLYRLDEEPGLERFLPYVQIGLIVLLIAKSW